MTDFSRLSSIWSAWAPKAGLTGVEILVARDDCEIAFKAADYCVQLRDDKDRWAIDTIDDRGQKRSEVATFSTFGLVEKYLVWDWATLARSGLASGPLGADLYRLGYAPGIEVSESSGGKIQVCLNGDCAMLVAGDATIFSHIMTKSIDQLLDIAKSAGL